MKPFEKYVKIEEERYLTLLENEERILKAIEYIEELYTRYIADYSDIERLEKILKGE